MKNIDVTQTYKKLFAEFVFSKYYKLYKDGVFNGKMLIDSLDDGIELDSYSDYELVVRLQSEFDTLTEDTKSLISERLTVLGEDTIDITVVIRNREDKEVDYEIDDMVKIIDDLGNNHKNIIMLLDFELYSSIVKYEDGIPTQDLDLLLIQSVKYQVNTLFKYINIIRSELAKDKSKALDEIRRKVEFNIAYDAADGLELVFV